MAARSAAFWLLARRGNYDWELRLASGLLFLNNRYHDPSLGVFISVDPLVASTGEAYIYASGNPTTLSDPSGLDPDTSAYARERKDGKGGCLYSERYNGCGGDQSWYQYGEGGNPLVVDDEGFTLDDLQFVPQELFDDSLANRDGGRSPGSGGCAGGQAGAGVMVDLSLCIVLLANEMGIVGSVGPGTGVNLEAVLEGGGFVTNAQDVQDLKGLSVCGSGTAAVGGGIQATVCAGVTSRGDFNGIFVVGSTGVVGAGGGTAVYLSRTVVLLDDHGLTYSRLGDLFDLLSPSGSAPPQGVCSGGAFNRTTADSMGMHQVSSC